MPSGDDFVNPLVEEILGDAADKFFNKRRTLEYQLELFNSYVEALKVRKQMLERRAATLNRLLLDRNTAEDFYRHLGVDDGSMLASIDASKADLASMKVPFAFSQGGRYRKLVADAYEKLQQRCREYLHGPGEQAAGRGHRKEEPISAYYSLVKSMAEILNREIADVNCNMTPSCTLQFAKNLSSDLGDKQRITGSSGSEYADLDAKMRYPHLDLHDLGIQAYPEIPPREKVDGAMRSFCRKLTRTRSHDVEQLLAGISKSMEDSSGR